MGNLNPYAKAVIAALIAGCGTFMVAAAQGGIALEEWGGIVAATLAGFLGVWATPNTPAPPKSGAGVYGTPAGRRRLPEYPPGADVPPDATRQFEVR